MPQSSPQPFPELQSSRSRIVQQIYDDLISNSIEIESMQSLPVPPVPPIPPEPHVYQWQSAYGSFELETSSRLRTAVEVRTEPATPEWPIGSILKWNYKFQVAKEHIIRNNKNVDYPLFELLGYSQDLTCISAMMYIGEVEVTHGSFELQFFTEATPKEVNHYNKILSQLKPCEEYPPIGKVVKYIGREGDKRHKAVVIGHIRNNRIKISWITGRNSGSNQNYDFNIFQIIKDQSGSFEPNMADYFTCPCCVSMNHINTARTIGENNYCGNDCAIESGHNYCRNCSQWHRIYTMSNTTSGLCCHGCMETYYRECVDCTQLVHVSNSREHNGGRQCYSCRHYEIRTIHSYDYKPRPIYSKALGENTRYLGIELEIELSGDKQRDLMAEKINIWLNQQSQQDGQDKKLKKLIYLKSDGSLNNGLEIVFHPYTLRSLHKTFPIKDFLEFLQEHGGGISDRCGMHVHVSKEKLSKISLIKGKWFFFRCEQFLKRLSDRKEFKYCQFEKQPTGDPYHQEFGRRTALNMAGSAKTLELRLFKGTLDYMKFMTNIQFSDAFVDYIQHGAGIAFYKTHSPHQIWIDFIDYCKKDGKYQVMTNYILRKGIV